MTMATRPTIGRAAFLDLALLTIACAGNRRRRDGSHKPAKRFWRLERHGASLARTPVRPHSISPKQCNLTDAVRRRG